MRRQDFMEAVASFAALTLAPVPSESKAPTTVPAWRDAFPSLRQRINGHPLVYLDSAATTLRPTPVIDALAQFYQTTNANPGAALHTLARRAQAALENARTTIASFIGATNPLEITFTRGTTEGLNLVAAIWGATHVSAGDENLIGIAEHASNMLPWRYLARQTGARLVTFDVDDQGRPRIDDIASKLTPRTRIVVFSHVSNVLGLVNPAREICDTVRGPNRVIVIVNYRRAMSTERLVQVERARQGMGRGKKFSNRSQPPGHGARSA